jgi:hypothetical protein
LIKCSQFEQKYREFERLDLENSPHTFHAFWEYKLKVEKQNSHLLDDENIEQTLEKLGPILKIWKWHRPHEFETCFNPLEKALRNVSDAYANIKDISLLELEKAQRKDLEKIWYALGSTKPEDGHGKYGELVMTITKPLMFLWGQTPAFDSIVRENMPSFDLAGFRNTRWKFNLWLNAMEKLQTSLKTDAELLNSFKKTSNQKYGTDQTIPYGQFFDICYWSEDMDEERTIETGCGRRRNAPTTVMNKNRSLEKQQKFINLLTKLKKDGKISAEEWREYRTQWEKSPQARYSIVDRLKHM